MAINFPATAVDGEIFTDADEVAWICQNSSITNPGTSFRWARVGVGASGGGGSGLEYDPVVKTANFTAALNTNYICNTVGGSFSVTLPTGVDGNEIGIIDYAGTFAQNPLTLISTADIFRSSDNGSIDIDNWNVPFIFIADKGWLPVATGKMSEAADENGVTTFPGAISEKHTNVSYDEFFVLGLNCHNGNSFSHTLGASITVSLDNPPSDGQAQGITLLLTCGTVPRLVTWPASVKWAGGEAPTLSDTSGAIDVFTLYTKDGGSNWYGFSAGQDLA